MNTELTRAEIEVRARDYLVRSSKIGDHPVVESEKLERLVKLEVAETIRQLKGVGVTVTE